MERRVTGNCHARCGTGENLAIASKSYLSSSYEMVAAAMESKRLGLCGKPLFAVPNHLTEQWAAEFLRLYPAANILVTTRKDFEKRNRKRFCSRIATGDYDAVIMGHSQFERIPISPERQELLLREQIDEIQNGIEELRYSRGERTTIKQLERTRKQLEARLDKLHKAERKDDVLTFEQLGVDRLFVVALRVPGGGSRHVLGALALDEEQQLLRFQAAVHVGKALERPPAAA